MVNFQGMRDGGLGKDYPRREGVHSHGVLSARSSLVHCLDCFRRARRAPRTVHCRYIVRTIVQCYNTYMYMILPLKQSSETCQAPPKSRRKRSPASYTSSRWLVPITCHSCCKITYAEKYLEYIQDSLNYQWKYAELFSDTDGVFFAFSVFKYCHWMKCISFHNKLNLNFSVILESTPNHQQKAFLRA